jgi:CDP-diacylglycerol--glycerol-3-phosphate 3-phosphatidyltransferase
MSDFPTVLENRYLWGWGIFFLFLAQGLISILWYAYKVKREVKDLINQNHDKTGSPILSETLREWYFEKLRAFEDFFIRHRFTPNMLTCIGFSFSILAASLFHFKWVGAGGWFVLVAGTFDILDGTVARKTNNCSPSGSYFDSVLDRYAEMIVYAGLLSYYLQSTQRWMIWVVLLAMVGAQMVSYTRAKAESVGVQAKVGIMQRPERFVFLGFGAFFSSHLNAALSPWIPQGQYLLMATVLFITFMTNLTAIRRFRFAFLHLKGASVN